MNIDRARWIALIILCLGDFMIVLDTSIINVALPSIKADLGFSESSLVWVVNAYMLTFGGFLLLGGRLGDLYGYKKFFVGGLTLFTVASLGCGISTSPLMLIIARALQGIGGAVVSAVALSLMMNLFTKDDERSYAMGIFGFVMAVGGSAGVFLGGIITNYLSWNWVFLVNIPIGIGVIMLSQRTIPESLDKNAHKKLDVIGAITITIALMLAVYAIVYGNEKGWLSFQTLGMLITSVILIVVFLWVESRVQAPLMPLSLFKLRNVSTANVVGGLWAAAMFAWFFISALYMQFVLNYTPLQVGLSFLPANIIMAVFSLGLSAKIVMRFGIKVPIVVGMILLSIGLALFGFAPLDGNFYFHILPGMVLLGLGAGMAINPVLLAAMSDVKQSDSGLASGVVNTSFMMGGALGLAILASLASYKTAALLSTGVLSNLAILEGYHWAFLVGAVFSGIAGTVGWLFFKVKKPTKEMMSAH